MAKHALKAGALIISAVAIATLSTAHAKERRSGATGIFRIFGFGDHPLPPDTMFPRRHVHRLQRNEVVVPKWQDRRLPAPQFETRAVAPAPIHYPSSPVPPNPPITLAPEQPALVDHDPLVQANRNGLHIAPQLDQGR